MLREFNLEGKVAVVTGAGRGLGKSIAMVLAEAGVDIVAAARTTAEIEATARQVQSLGRRAVAVSVDIAREEDVENLARVAISQFGKVDVWVNNAGAAVIKPLVPLPELKSIFSELLPNFGEPTVAEDWRLIIDTNLVGTILCCRAIGPQMIEQRSGKVINIGSVWGAQATEFYAIYSAAKAGVSMLTRCLAKEWGRYNISVNAVLPGYFPTSATRFYYENERVRQTMLRQVPLRRFGEPREAGLLVAFLASDASNYLTGQTIALDGGLVC